MDSLFCSLHNCNHNVDEASPSPGTIAPTDPHSSSCVGAEFGVVDALPHIAYGEFSVVELLQRVLALTTAFQTPWTGPLVVKPVSVLVWIQLSAFDTKQRYFPANKCHVIAPVFNYFDMIRTKVQI